MMLLLVSVAALAAGSPTPQNSGKMYKCPEIIATGSTTTPPIKIGTQEYPTVTISSFNPGQNERLVCSYGGGLATFAGVPTAIIYGE